MRLCISAFLHLCVFLTVSTCASELRHFAAVTLEARLHGARTELCADAEIPGIAVMATPVAAGDEFPEGTERDLLLRANEEAHISTRHSGPSFHDSQGALPKTDEDEIGPLADREDILEHVKQSGLIYVLGKNQIVARILSNRNDAHSHTHTVCHPHSVSPTPSH